MKIPTDDFRMIRNPRLLPLGLLFFLFISLLWYAHATGRITSFTRGSTSTTHVPEALSFKPPPESVNAVYNSTLGFQKTFVLNLAERPDKLDTYALVSIVTGFTADVIPGVKGENVVNKALPTLEGLPENPDDKNNVVGCWRAHLDFAQKVVTDQLSTALVMEDDADWDTGLKDQLAMFAQGSQFVAGISSSDKPHSPYGDDWDMLWFGHCSSQFMPDDERRFIIENDITVPLPIHRVNFAFKPDMEGEGYDNSTRVIYRASDGVCLYAYALSNRGARKVLRSQAQMTKWAPIDIGIGRLCRDNHDFKCIAAFPQLIDSHKGAGRLSRDSDIATFSPQEKRQKGYTFNIVHSTRLNIDHLLNGETDAIESQWPDQPEIEGPPRARAVGRVFD